MLSEAVSSVNHEVKLKSVLETQKVINLPLVRHNSGITNRIEIEPSVLHLNSEQID